MDAAPVRRGLTGRSRHINPSAPPCASRVPPNTTSPWSSSEPSPVSSWQQPKHLPLRPNLLLRHAFASEAVVFGVHELLKPLRVQRPPQPRRALQGVFMPGAEVMPPAER